MTSSVALLPLRQALPLTPDFTDSARLACSGGPPFPSSVFGAVGSHSEAPTPVSLHGYGPSDFRLSRDLSTEVKILFLLFLFKNSFVCARFA